MEDDLVLFESPTGERCTTLEEAFDLHKASSSNQDKDSDMAATKNIVHLGEDDQGDKADNDGGPVEESRVVVTTSTIEDWLWRGTDPVVKDMSLQVYCMWVYRVEKPPPHKS